MTILSIMFYILKCFYLKLNILNNSLALFILFDTKLRLNLQTMLQFYFIFVTPERKFTFDSWLHYTYIFYNINKYIYISRHAADRIAVTAVHGAFTSDTIVPPSLCDIPTYINIYEFFIFLFFFFSWSINFFISSCS